jgi:hypothetical protein
LAFRPRRGSALSCMAFAIVVWSGLLVGPVSHHLLTHGTSPMNAQQHSSPLCAWMCSAASAVHSADAVPERTLFLTGLQPAVEFESLFEKPFDESPTIRPPPFVLS